MWIKADEAHFSLAAVCLSPIIPVRLPTFQHTAMDTADQRSCLQSYIIEFLGKELDASTSMKDTISNRILKHRKKEKQ